ncbi:methylenetetrahydrofolate reductase [Paenibacillus harenae]|uniref:methylenetetrahydrofolate reductase n=1 Tax=Paenibacillus harenae TaxID=306543 RepID=UPI0004201570|nr:methylenetetrahydrofolate reductase [Paenibacillus harenae]
MRISLELVPREADELRAELQFIKNRFPIINTINIPDLTRFELRSWEAAALSQEGDKASIPHIRAMDFQMENPLPFVPYLDEHGITEVLVVTGDAPKNSGLPTYPTTCTDMIAKIKKEHPHLKVYAAIDPYRNSASKEYDYVQRKMDAGADGFFTQPFFDLRFMEQYAEMLEGLEVFWGVSPVVSDKSKAYWETRNQVVFPPDFQPTLAWNIEFSRKALALAKRLNSPIYFMPIKVDLAAYLEGVFSEVSV